MLYGRAKRDSSIATSSFDAIATIDAEGRFTFVPPTVERITGYRVEELAQRTRAVRARLDRPTILVTIVALTCEILKDHVINLPSPVVVG